jgi:hypothetical protein
MTKAFVHPDMYLKHALPISEIRSEDECGYVYVNIVAHTDKYRCRGKRRSSTGIKGETFLAVSLRPEFILLSTKQTSLAPLLTPPPPTLQLSGK